jgi:hypothetical protein
MTVMKPKAAPHSRMAFSGRSAQPHGFFQHPVKYRSKVAGRGIDDLQDFGHRSLLRLGLVTLPGALVQFPLQLSVGSPKIGYFVIERRGHVLLRRALLPTRIDTLISTRLQPRRVCDSITFSSKPSSRLPTSRSSDRLNATAMADPVARASSDECLRKGSPPPPSG